MMHGDGCGWGMGLWGLLGLLILAAVVAAAVWGGVTLARRGGGGHTGAQPVDGDDARERLRRRYAAGEIDEEEFERRLDVLKR